MARRPSLDALQLAADWCRSFEAAPDDTTSAEDLESVAAWLEAQAGRAEESAAAARMVAQAFPAGLPPKDRRRALAMARQKLREISNTKPKATS